MIPISAHHLIEMTCEDVVNNGTSPMKYPGIILLSAALGIGAIGIGYLLAPGWMYARYGLTIDSMNEANMVRGPMAASSWRPPCCSCSVGYTHDWRDQR
jgi:hypothetical protein